MNPLSPAAPRKLPHRRHVACFGYAREDGLWDSEGHHLVDTKTYGLHHLDRGPTPAGQPLHEMWLRLTLDVDLNIVAVEAKTVWGPDTMRGDITPNFQRLKGLTIKGGFSQKCREVLGATQGCTLLVELLGPIATTAFQTVYSEKLKRDRAAGERKRPALIDSCHAWASDSPMVEKHYPEFFTARKKATAG